MGRWPWLATLRQPVQWFFFGEMQLTPLMKQVRVVSGSRRSIEDAPAAAGEGSGAAREAHADYPIGAKRVLFNDDY